MLPEIENLKLFINETICEKRIEFKRLLKKGTNRIST